MLPARLQHRTLPRVSARSSLPSRHLPASEPLSAASNQRAHLLQHRLPCPRPTSTVLVSQGAVGVTCPLTFKRTSPWRRCDCFMENKAMWKDCCWLCLFYKLQASSHVMNIPPPLPRRSWSACLTLPMHFHRGEQFSSVQYGIWCHMTSKQFRHFNIVVTLDDGNVNNCAPYRTDLWRSSVYDPAVCDVNVSSSNTLPPLTHPLCVWVYLHLFENNVIFNLNPCTELSLMFSFLIFSLCSPTVVVSL